MFRSGVLVSICALVVHTSHHHHSCSEEIAKERADDLNQHNCRSCKEFALVTTANCPQTGYDCDSTLPTTSNVLGHGCECSQLRCSDKNATLAVLGSIVGKVRCVDQKWLTRADDVAASGVCARKCDLGVCKALPDSDFDNDPLYAPFVVRSPDDTHSCAWGSCDNGAVGLTGETTVSYGPSAVFSCTGNGQWKGGDGKKHDIVKCIRKAPIPCKPLTVKDYSVDGCMGSTCYDPIEASELAFVCPPNSIPYVYTLTDFWVMEVKCVDGGWMYDMRKKFLDVYNQEEFDEIIPSADQQFTCTNY